MLSFDDTKIAFRDKSNLQLKKAYRIFSMVKSPVLVKIGSFFLNLANNLNFPISWALKNTVFSHFCGGQTIEECETTISSLNKNNIQVVLDYGAEGLKNELEFDKTKNRIIETIEMAKQNQGIAYAVFKPTGIGRLKLLKKVDALDDLNQEEEQEFERFKARAYEICQKAFDSRVPVMIDAEESWIQKPIDELVEELMARFNKEMPIVFHTIQLYRTDKLFYLKKLSNYAFQNKYIPAFKLVRGAYMEKENHRAKKKLYVSPIQRNKKSTDTAFDHAVEFCLENIDKMAVCIATHNQHSCMKAVNFLEKNNINISNPNIFFSQLLGMSDNISYNLAANGYNVCKYVPYGPIKLVMPYLMRRAQENSSVTNQSGKELSLIKKELRRRKKEKC